jgi:hypothetical protein
MHDDTPIPPFERQKGGITFKNKDSLPISAVLKGDIRGKFAYIVFRRLFLLLS